MTLPQDQIKPNTNFTYPSERPYYDEATSVLGAEVVADPDNSGVNYGITDPQVTEPIAGTGSETGNVTATP